MRLPEPKKLPSGKWYIQIMVDKKRYNQAFETKEQAEYWAAGLKTKSIEMHRAPASLSVSNAIERYIESKSAILSPTTIRSYNAMKRSLGEIAATPLNDLTQEKIQRWVNQLSKKKAPKTVKNMHGLISTILREYRPDMVLRTSLPKKIKREIQIPSETEIKAILTACKGDKYELPIMLAVWLGLRQSEILGLKWSDIDGETLKIHNAYVRGEKGMVDKTPKTYDGTRTVHISPQLMKLLNKQDRKSERIVPMSAQAIYSGFCRICANAGVRHFRFHDLRHVNASAMLAVGVPDKYSMKRIGHATNNMLKTTYQHTIKEKEIEYDQKIENYIGSLMPDK